MDNFSKKIAIIMESFGNSDSNYDDVARAQESKKGLYHDAIAVTHHPESPKGKTGLMWPESWSSRLVKKDEEKGTKDKLIDIKPVPYQVNLTTKLHPKGFPDKSELESKHEVKIA